jgi:pimeloyl-ACP methyl ester carboxylesterase
VASPRGAGNRCPFPRRVRIVLDVLDDIRRRFPIDPDRTYLAGFSGGGRVACTIGFALPELFGGVISFCAAGDLRNESWLRHRVRDRLSVALVTGETDFNRGEIERFRGPLLKEVGVRTRVWVEPKTGHAVPAGPVPEVFAWLERDRPRRAELAAAWPASRIAADTAPGRRETARALLAEANTRLARPDSLYSGLMLLKGIRVRWTGLPEARAAEKTLLEYDSRDRRPWEQQDITEQRRFLLARARGIDAYASGPLPRQYAAGRGDMLQAAITLWTRILGDGRDADAVRQARQRIPLLRKRLAELEKAADGKKTPKDRR